MPAGSNTLFLWNSNTTPPGPPDITIVGIGQNGDLPFVGKWGGPGPSSIGLIRAGAPLADLNTLFLWNGIPPNPPGAPTSVISGIGVSGDVPFGGTWDGASQGVGLFRSGQPPA